MNDFLENMWDLEQKKFAEWQKFRELPTEKQIEILNQKLDWERYDKLKTDFFLEVLERYVVEEEIFINIWHNWLKISVLQEFRRRDGIVSFFYRNPQLKQEMIAELNQIISENPVKMHTSEGEKPDESVIYNAILILWDLEYKTALQDLIKKYKTVCDLYLDEEDYQKINELEENNI